MMRRPTRTTLRVSLATAFALLGDQVLYSVLPVYFQSFGLMPFQVGILLSANRWIRLLTNPLAHAAHQRFSSHWLFPSAFALGALTTLMYVHTASFLWLLVARMLWGLAWSFIRHFGVLVIMDDTPPQYAGQTMGTYNGVSGLGAVAGLFGGALLVETVGYSSAIGVLALSSLLSLPLILGVRRFAGDTRDASAANDGDSNRPAALVALGFVVSLVGPGFVMSTLGYVLHSRLGDEVQLFSWEIGAASLTGALLAVRFGFDIIGAPVMGAITDRRELRAVAALLFALGAAALAAAASLPGMVPLVTGVVGFFVCATALTSALAGAAARRGSGSYARFVTAGDVGAALGPLLGWTAMEWIASPVLGLAMGAGCYAVGAVISALFLRRETG